MNHFQTLARTVILILILVGVAIGSPIALASQTDADWDPKRVQVERADLEKLLARLDQAVASTAYSPGLRERARMEGALVRTRLEEGDFQVGDQIQVTVQGQAQLSDTFTVAVGRVLVLPTIGNVPMKGILRSEVEGYLTRYLSRFLKEPVVTASSSMRVLITGAVTRAGFYVLPADMALSDVLMSANGLTPNAGLQKIRVQRGKLRLLEGKVLQDAITEGKTLDQLSVQAGDEIVVPASTAALPGMEWLTALAPLMILFSAFGRFL